MTLWFLTREIQAKTARVLHQVIHECGCCADRFRLTREFRCQRLEWMCSGSENMYLPIRTAFGWPYAIQERPTLFECRDQSCSYQRRFATAGGANNNGKKSGFS